MAAVRHFAAADISTIRATAKPSEHMKRIAVKQGTQAFRIIPDRCCRPDYVNMGNCL